MLRKFSSKRILETFLREIDGQFYVYCLFRPDGRIFYVGKGKGRRIVEHELEALRAHPMGETNPIKCNVIRKIHREGGQVVYGIDSVYDARDEASCYGREAELIDRFGRLHEGGPLTNLACGAGSTAGRAPYSTERHAATLSGAPKGNPDRARLNVFLTGLGPVSSVPIKPVAQLARILPTTPHPKPRKPTARSAYAIMASAIAHGLPLRPGVRVPRSFVYEGVAGIIENGAARDLIKAGMANLIPAQDPRQEHLELDAGHCATIGALVGVERLADLGLV